MKFGWFLLLLIVLIFAMSQCGRKQDAETSLNSGNENVVTENVARSASPPNTLEGTPFNVASDPNASYRLLKWSRMRNGNFEALTVREGPSGTSFARREISCDDQTFRYLGEGDTLRESMRDSPNIGDMSGLVPGSIADVTVDVVCAEARR